MHPDFIQADQWSAKIIGAAIEVHRVMGPGLIESIYERCLLHECRLRRIPVETQVVVPIIYKDYTFDEPLKLDLYVDKCLIIELKAIEKVLPNS